MPEQILCEMGQSRVIGETRSNGTIPWTTWVRGVETTEQVPNEWLVAIRIESPSLRPIGRTRMPQEAAGMITVSLGRRTIVFDEARDRSVRVLLPVPLSLPDWSSHLAIGWVRKRVR